MDVHRRRREAWSETAIAGLQARQQEPRSGLSGPSSAFLSDRVSGHGSLLLLLGGVQAAELREGLHSPCPPLWLWTLHLRRGQG